MLQRLRARRVSRSFLLAGLRRFPPLLVVLLRLLTRSLARLSARGRLYRNSRATSLAQANGNSLLRRARTMFAFPHMLDFFLHKFTRRRRRRLTYAQILFGLLRCLLLWHDACPYCEFPAAYSCELGFIPSARMRTGSAHSSRQFRRYRKVMLLSTEIAVVLHRALEQFVTAVFVSSAVIPQLRH